MIKIKGKLKDIRIGKHKRIIRKLRPEEKAHFKNLIKMSRYVITDMKRKIKVAKTILKRGTIREIEYEDHLY